MAHRRYLGMVLVAVALAAGGCGGDDAAAGRDAVTVYAASSLRTALPQVDPGARLSLGGSGTLRRQIEAGAPADVFVAADAADARALAAAGRCERPRLVAGNRLVLLVARAAGGRVGALADLRRGGLRLAIGAAGVPAGDYARALLRRAGALEVLRRNRVSAERDVAGVTGKVALGSADAGFAYRTDARAVAGRVGVVALPAGAQPPIRYVTCVVRRPGRKPGATAAARRYVDALTGAVGRRALRRAGFVVGPA